ncbi:MAG: ATP-NAD kinase, partial [Theionarchaea archaeon]|nr:ATP-NAD kinase [Theionarchaea archaeon]
MMGLIVNPVAGLGGPVGLKGTDHLVEEALTRGGIPQAERRAVRMLEWLKQD